MKTQVKNLGIALIVGLFLSLNLYAADVPPTAVVTKLIGNVTFENKPLKLGDEIKEAGILKTSEKSFVQFKVDKWKNFISISPNSTMNLNFSDEKKYTLEEGECRWKSFARSEIKGKIFTRQASMGVRGTDFLLISNPLLGETEIIMFDGVVHFENIADKSNAFDIEKNQWGGIGGRFGQKINPPLNLPKNVIEVFEKKLE